MSDDPLAEAGLEPLGSSDPLALALMEQGIDIHSILSEVEIQEARATAVKRVSADEKKQAKEAIIASEMARLTRKSGNSYLDEEVWVNVDLAPYADRMVIDHKIYLNNHMYKLPRHMANSMNEMMARTWDHEADIKGESMTQKIGRYRVGHFKEAVMDAPNQDSRFKISAREAALDGVAI